MDYGRAIPTTCAVARKALTIFVMILCCESQHMCGHSQGVLGKHWSTEAKLWNVFFPASIYGAVAVFLAGFLSAAGWLHIWLTKLVRELPTGLV